MRRILLSAYLIMGCSFIIQAQPDSLMIGTDSPIDENGNGFNSTGDFDLQPEFKIKLYGDHFFQYHLPVDKNHNNYNTLITVPKLFNTMGIHVVNNNIELVSEWEFRGMSSKTGEWDSLSDIRIGENYMKWNPGKLNLGFGFQNYTWGVADELNPTDNLNPENYEMGYKIEKIPVLSASMKYYPADWLSLEGVYIPFEQSDEYFFDTRDEIPVELFQETCFSGFNLTTQQPETSLIPAEKLVNYDYPKYNYESGILGIKSSFYSSSVDFSISYIYDLDPFFTPQIELEQYAIESSEELENELYSNLPAEDANNIINELSGYDAFRVKEVGLKRARIQRLGFDVKTIVDRYGIWLESCYSITEDKNNDSYKIRNHDLAWTAGFDFFYGPNDRFYVNFQYTGKWIPDFDNKFYTDYSGGMPDENYLNDEQYMEEYYYRALVQPLGIQTESATHGFMAQLEWTFLDGKIKPVINGYYTIPVDYDKKEKKRYGSLLLMPEIDFAPGNSLHLFLGTNLAYSWFKPAGSNTVKNNDRSDLIGYLYPYNNIYFKISYKWNHTQKR
jgi:hypothetical protein